MDDTQKLECFADVRLMQLEPDRPKPKRHRKPPPQVETLIHLEEYDNGVALHGESLEDHKV